MPPLTKESSIPTANQPTQQPSKILIKAISAPHKHDRRFLVHRGISFYQSSGRNSGCAGTWFPCLVILQSDNPYGLNSEDEINHSQGWIIKSQHLSQVLGLEEANNLLEKNKFSYFAQKQLATNDNNDNYKSFFKRMPHTQLMYYSAELGGGLWKTQLGKKLKRKLKKAYPESSFFQVKIKTSHHVETDLEINRYLAAEGCGSR